MRAAELKWEEKGPHHIYRTERSAFAPLAVLEHSVGSAGFEVFQDNDGWRCTFWHGNRGHTIACNQGSREAAQAAAQTHVDNLVTALVANAVYPPSDQ